MGNISSFSFDLTLLDIVVIFIEISSFLYNKLYGSSSAIQIEEDFLVDRKLEPSELVYFAKFAPEFYHLTFNNHHKDKKKLFCIFNCGEKHKWGMNSIAKNLWKDVSLIIESSNADFKQHSAYSTKIGPFLQNLCSEIKQSYLSFNNRHKIITVDIYSYSHSLMWMFAYLAPVDIERAASLIIAYISFMHQILFPNMPICNKTIDFRVRNLLALQATCQDNIFIPYNYLFNLETLPIRKLTISEILFCKISILNNDLSKLINRLEQLESSVESFPQSNNFSFLNHDGSKISLVHLYL